MFYMHEWKDFLRYCVTERRGDTVLLLAASIVAVFLLIALYHASW